MRRSIVVLISVASLASLTAQAPNPVRWSLSTDRAAVAAGGKLQASLTAAIDAGWHLYSMKVLEGGPIPTTITVPAGQPFRQAGPVGAPVPLRKDDEAFGMEVEYYIADAKFVVPLQAARDAAPGKSAVTVSVRYQVCDDKLCLPPRTLQVEAPVEVTGGAR